MHNTSRLSSFSKLLVFFILIIIFLLSFMLLFSVNFAKADTTVNTDLEVKIRDMLALSLENCDSSSNAVLKLNVYPTPVGAFKSNCQTVTINTNSPGYSLMVKSSSSDLLYQNPTTLQNLPTIPSTSNTISNPGVLSNDTWGFAVEGNTDLGFDTTYTIDNASNKYAQLATTDTTVYQIIEWPIQKKSHKFYYGTSATTETVAGTYATTITYTAIGEDVKPVRLEFIQISAGTFHTCGIATDDNAYCWGRGNSGQLGNGRNDSITSTPAAVSKLAGGLEGLKVKQIFASYNHTCAIASDDNAYCWGEGASGQLGNGSTANVNVPTPVSKLSDGLAGLTVSQISSNSYQTCATASDGNAYCWGDNTEGQLGDGSNTNSNIPVRVAKLAGGMAGLTVTQVSTGWQHSCAIADGNVYCWGRGGNGQLGQNSGGSSYVPVAVVKLSGGLDGLTVKQLVTGATHSCVLASDNNAYCWGAGSSGQLGNASSGNSNRPVAVSKLAGGLDGLTVTQISARSATTCIVASDDNAYCFGAGTDGQIGNGLNDNVNIPTQISRLPDALGDQAITQISVGNNHTCLITSVNNTYCWGLAQNGRLGNGSSTANSNIPVKVINPTP